MVNQNVAMPEECDPRVEKYLQKITSKPSRKNQVFLEGGAVHLILHGKNVSCTKVEGYVKLPSMDSITAWSAVNCSISILPKNRLILADLTQKQCYFRGYQKENDECFLLLHVVTSNEDLLIVDFGLDEIPAIILLEDFDEEDINDRLFQFFDYCMKRGFKLQTNLTDKEVEMGAEDDAWE